MEHYSAGIEQPHAPVLFMSNHSPHFKSPFMLKHVNDRFCTVAMLPSKKLTYWPIHDDQHDHDGPLLKTYDNMLHNKLLPSTYNGNITVVALLV